MRINFAYEGYANAFNMVNEVRNPIRTIKFAGPAALIGIAVLYMFVNIAYFAAGKFNPLARFVAHFNMFHSAKS